MSQDLERAIKREYARIHRKMEAAVREAVRKNPLMPIEYALGIVVSQNVLRDCMVAVTNEAMPQPRAYFLELAVRLACYLITALPVDEQEMGAMAVQQGIMNKLGEMQASGHVFNTEWGD